MGLGLGVARVVQTILRRSKYLHHGFRGVSVCVCVIYNDDQLLFSRSSREV